MFRFYSDPALTTPLASLSMTTMLDGSSSDPVSAVVYFGKPAAGTTATPVTGSQITISPADSNTGSGLPASAVKLSLTEAGLSSATAGASLNIGASLDSGAGNAVAVWVSVSAGSAAVGNYTDLSLVTNGILEA